MILVTCPVICATVLGWRYMAKQEHDEDRRQEASHRVERVQLQQQAADITRQCAAVIDSVRKDYASLEKSHTRLSERVDGAMAALATSERAREQLEGKVNRLGGGR